MLSKTYRLRKRGSFNFVYNKGERKSAGSLGLVWVRGKVLKVGFSVPNKVGKAVVRNKVKRRLRAIVQNLLPKLSPAQIVIAAKPGAETLGFDELKKTAKDLLARAKLLKE